MERKQQESLNEAIKNVVEYKSSLNTKNDVTLQNPEAYKTTDALLKYRELFIKIRNDSYDETPEIMSLDLRYGMEDESIDDAKLIKDKIVDNKKLYDKLSSRLKNQWAKFEKELNAIDKEFAQSFKKIK